MSTRRMSFVGAMQGEVLQMTRSASYQDALKRLLTSFRSSDYVDDLCASLSTRQLCIECQSAFDNISRFILAANKERDGPTPHTDIFWPPRAPTEGGRSYSDGYRFLPPDEVKYVDGEELPPNVIKYHAAAKNVVMSAKTCAFCEIVRVALLMDTFRRIGYPYDKPTEPFQNVMMYIKFGFGSEAFERAIADLKSSDDPIFLMLWDTISFKRGGAMKGKFKLGHIRLIWQRPEMSLHNHDRKVVFTRLNVFQADRKQRNSTYVSKRQPLRASNSMDAFNLMRSWLRRCQTHHKRCFGSIAREQLDVSEMFELPTRLLDVGVQGSEHEPRLVETAGFSKGRWIALSHCWGEPTHHPLKTTKANLDNHCRSIPLSILPKTFLDAVIMTKVLGLRYLWIDSLCIIQDAEEDWLRESEDMARIYEHAVLTLAASSAQNCSKGLFIKRDYSSLQTPFVSLPLRTGGAPIIDQGAPYHVSIGIEWRQEPFIQPLDPYYITPLALRGWATQEWILSRRLIHFLDDGLIWVCKSHAEDEAGQLLVGRGLPQAEWCTEWGKIIQEHSTRSFTFQRDKLIALEGLAREIAKTRQFKTIPGPDEWISNGNYAFGVFEIDIPEHLLWSPITLGCKLEMFPSWSWAAHSEPIWFQFREFDKNRQDVNFTTGCGVHKMDQATGALDVVAKRYSIGHMLGRRLGKDEHGVYGHITYRGAPHPGYSIENTDQESLGWAVFDDARDYEDHKDVYFLHLAAVDYYTPPNTEYYGLLLADTAASDDSYVRIGMCAVRDITWMEAEPTVITRLV